MKVLILSTFGNYGGAAVCSNRLTNALRKINVDVTLGVLMKYDNQLNIGIYRQSFFRRWGAWILFILERMEVLFSIKKRKYLYKFSTASFGVDIVDHPFVKEADIINIHWANFGLISLTSLRKLSEIKPIVWTLHDMWTFTGGCHYALECINFRSSCEQCFYLRSNSKLSMKTLKEKQNLWGDISLNLIATSNWLKDEAMKSSLLINREVRWVGSTIDTQLYNPMDKIALRLKYAIPEGKFFILFGAVDLTDERKGFSHLMKILKSLESENKNIHLLTFGNAQVSFEGIDFTSFGKIDSEEQLVEIYNLADLFILPSIQDNLPNTVMESMACGTPVVAFDCGGVNDLIIHKENGYLAENKNDQALGEGILYLFNEKERLKMGKKARNHIVENYNEEKIARTYVNLFNDMINRYKDSLADQ